MTTTAVWRSLVLPNMRALILSESCNPERPSLPIVAYNAVKAIADHADLVVATHVRNRPVLEKTAATGALMNRDHAPDWVVVTDAQGNRLCLCTEAGARPGGPP